MKKSDIELGQQYLAYADIVVLADEFVQGGVSCSVVDTLGGGDSPYFEYSGQAITVPFGKLSPLYELELQRMNEWHQATEFAVGLGFKVAVHARGVPTIYLDEANVQRLRDITTVKATVTSNDPPKGRSVPPHHIPSSAPDYPDQKDLML